MEFLVRLTDKRANVVFCLNPVHKDFLMQRVFFVDDTHVAACPDCNSADYLYRKNNSISKKGHFITFKEDGWTWGTNERKHYGIVQIDCTYEQAQGWCQQIRDEQALLDEKQYRTDYEQRKALLISEGKTKEEIRADIQLQQIAENARLARNQIIIAARFRKHFFDYEAVLKPNQLRNWNDENVESDIISISETDKAEIKEILWP